MYPAVDGGVEPHPVDLLMPRQEAVIGILVIHPKPDEQGDGHPDGEAKDIQGAIDLIGDEVAPGSFDVIS